MYWVTLRGGGVGSESRRPRLPHAVPAPCSAQAWCKQAARVPHSSVASDGSHSPLLLLGRTVKITCASPSMPSSTPCFFSPASARLVADGGNRKERLPACVQNSCRDSAGVIRQMIRWYHTNVMYLRRMWTRRVEDGSLS